MEALILIALIALGAFVYYVKKQNNSAPTPAAPPSQSDEARIENVGAGGMIHISTLGPTMDDVDLKITARHIYNEDGYEWIELEGDSGTDKVWLDVEDDDGISVSATLNKLKLRDLGLSKKDLERFDDDESGSFQYQGSTYHYEDSNEATFYAHGDRSKPQTFYYWDFETDDGKHFIGVERWGSDYEAFCGEPVKASQITVYSTRDSAGHV